MRVVPANVAPGVFDVTGLGDHLEVALAVEQQPQPAAYDGVIVGDDNANPLHRAFLGVAVALDRRNVLMTHPVNAARLPASGGRAGDCSVALCLALE